MAKQVYFENMGMAVVIVDGISFEYFALLTHCHYGNSWKLFLMSLPLSDLYFYGLYFPVSVKSTFLVPNEGYYSEVFY